MTITQTPFELASYIHATEKLGALRRHDLHACETSQHSYKIELWNAWTLRASDCGLFAIE
jgi:hypothetical protein